MLSLNRTGSDGLKFSWADSVRSGVHTSASTWQLYEGTGTWTQSIPLGKQIYFNPFGNSGIISGNKGMAKCTGVMKKLVRLPQKAKCDGN
jgi:hypothetical protein